MNDDHVYLVMLVFSITFGGVTRNIQNATLRKWISSVVGLVVIFAVSGSHTIHPIVSFILHVSLINLTPKENVHWVNFFVGFAYLIFFRLCGYGPEWLCTVAPGHTNAIQMMMTLKLMGLAFEVHDSKSDDGDSIEQRYRRVNPSLLDTFHYVFTHAGILTGPYFKFRTYEDSYLCGYSSHADCFNAVVRRMRPVPVYIGLFLISDYLWPLRDVEDESFYETSSLLGRIVYMTPVFFNFRMRLYTGFVLSECSCIMAGIGAYPKRSLPQPGNGPTKLNVLEEIGRDGSGEEMDFETVHNIDEWGAESVSTMREALKTWNMTVQYWLAANIYRRLSGKASRAVRTLAVMAVSSVWHGIYAGYYLSLCSVAFVLPVEDLYDKVVRRKLLENGWNGTLAAYDWIGWFVRFQWFSYLGMAFRLLRIDLTWQFWTSVYFIGHLSLPIFYIIGVVLFKPVAGILFKSSRQKLAKEPQKQD